MSKAPERATDSPARMTYYKYKCPARIHQFVLLDDVETCIHCYLDDAKLNEISQKEGFRGDKYRQSKTKVIQLNNIIHGGSVDG